MMGRLVSLGGWGGWGGGSGQVTSGSTRPPPKDRLQKPSGDHLLFKRDRLLIKSSFQPQMRVCKPAGPSTPPPPPPPWSKSPKAAKMKTKPCWRWGCYSLNSPEPELPRCSPSEGPVANRAPSPGRPGSGGYFRTKLVKCWTTTKKES